MCIRDSPNPALKLLRDKGVLILETSASRGVGDKKELVAALDIPPEEAMAQVTPKRRSAPLRYAVTELLCALGSASAKELCYFTGASNSTLRSLAKSGILRLEPVSYTHLAARCGYFFVVQKHDSAEARRFPVPAPPQVYSQKIDFPSTCQPTGNTV